MKLTIFTPTYNRKKEIQGLYKSIKKALQQKEALDTVEWLVVDDGSAVDIKSVIESLEVPDGLNIRYIRKENGGKHTAYNAAIDECDSDIFVCIDDDDRLTDNAVKDMFRLAKKYTGMKKYSNCSGFAGRAAGRNGHKLGRDLKTDSFISNTIEIRDRFHFWGEPEIYFTEILKGYRFDVFENEKFLTEAYLFDTLTKRHPLIYTNCVLMKKIYLKGGLTDNQLKIRIESPRGTEAYYYRRSKLSCDVLHRLKAVINRQRFAFWIDGERPVRGIDLLEIFARPFSGVLYLRDRVMIKAGRLR